MNSLDISFLRYLNKIKSLSNSIINETLDVIFNINSKKPLNLKSYLLINNKTFINRRLCCFFNNKNKIEFSKVIGSYYSYEISCLLNNKKDLPTNIDLLFFDQSSFNLLKSNKTKFNIISKSYILIVGSKLFSDLKKLLSSRVLFLYGNKSNIVCSSLGKLFCTNSVLLDNFNTLYSKVRLLLELFIHKSSVLSCYIKSTQSSSFRII